VQQLINDIRALQPMIMRAAPWILNRVVDGMKRRIRTRPGFGQSLIQWAVAAKVERLRANRPHSLLLDALLFAQTRAVLDAKLRVLISGGAPIVPQGFAFLVGTGTPNILQGCSMTEMASFCFVQKIPSRRSTPSCSSSGGSPTSPSGTPRETSHRGGTHPRHK
jgi:long-chain acyl-CoA synthetase